MYVEDYARLPLKVDRYFQKAPVYLSYLIFGKQFMDYSQGKDG